MPITRQKKEKILNELTERAKKASVVVFVNFHGLSTALSQQVRRLMRKCGASYVVAKRTLIKKAFEQTSLITGEMPELKGETALVFGEGEIMEPIKSLAQFIKQHPVMTMIGGVFDNGFVGRESMINIAKLPSREILLGQLMGIINGPARQLVGVLQAPMRDFISVLNQIKK